MEDAVGSAADARRGCVTIMFGGADAVTGTERLVMVLAETRETGAAEQDGVRARVAGATVEVSAEPLDEAVLVPPHAALETSSGKPGRAACRGFEAANA